jgi:serine/threonine protein kinase
LKKPIPFGKYILLERINVGGMAEVFLAKAYGGEGFERLLAIKKILPTMVEDDEFITMFLDEAKISVQLNHPNVVQIHELGMQEEQYYIAMDYVAGRDLRTLLERYRRRKETMPLQQAAYLAKCMAEGLDYAHKKKDARGMDLNIVHRDVSPQNILVSYEGEVKIIDFGIAKAANRAQKTQAGILKGKFGYMSPEQVRGLPIDRRSDIFALGVVMYEMMTGEKLFQGESDFSTLEKVRNAEVPSPRKFNTGMPPGLEKVLYKVLAREVEDRYQWGSELAEDLTPFLGTPGAQYGQERLSMFMRDAFAEEVLREAKRMEQYVGVEPPKPAQPSENPNDPTVRGQKAYAEDSTNRNPDAKATVQPRKATAAMPKAVTPSGSGPVVPAPRSAPNLSAPKLPTARPAEPSRAKPLGGAPVGKRPTMALDPVAAAMAELEPPAPPQAAPVHETEPKGSAQDDPNNPYIPPPTEEELAEMGTSDRTEMFRPMFTPEEPPKGERRNGNGRAEPAVSLRPPEPAQAPRADSETMMETRPPELSPSRQNGHANGPSSTGAHPNSVSGSNRKAPTRSEVPSTPEPVRARPNARQEEAPRDDNSTVKPNAQRLSNLSDEPEEAEATVGPSPVSRSPLSNRPDRPRPGTGAIPKVRPAPRQVEPDEDDQSTQMGLNRDEEPQDLDLDEGQDQDQDEMPPPPQTGPSRAVLIGGAAFAVVAVVLGAVGLMKVFGGPATGTVVVSVEPKRAGVGLLVDDKMAQLDSEVPLPVGTHTVTLKVKGMPDQPKIVEIEKGKTQPVVFNIEEPKPEPKVEPKPDDKKPDEPKPDGTVAANPEKPVDPPKPDPKPDPAPEPPKPVSKTFTLAVETTPPGATVTLAKKPAVKSPTSFKDLDKTKPVDITVSMKGFKTAKEHVLWASGDDPQILSVTLEEDVKAAPKPTPPKPTPPKPTPTPPKPAPPKPDAVVKVEPPKPTPTPKPDPAPKEEAPKPMPGKNKSFLVASTNPVSKVFIDGKPTNRFTPIPLSKPIEVPIGKHTVKFDDGKGHVLSLSDIQFEAGDTVRLVGLELK